MYNELEEQTVVGGVYFSLYFEIVSKDKAI